MTQHLLLPWGGALARIDADSTPLGQRGAQWVTHPFATWENPADDEANIAWVRDYRKANAPFTTGGVYLNFIGDEGDDRIKAAFGAEKYDRLAQIKAEYDPANVFAGNQNIRPIGACLSWLQPAMALIWVEQGVGRRQVALHHAAGLWPCRARSRTARRSAARSGSRSRRR